MRKFLLSLFLCSSALCYAETDPIAEVYARLDSAITQVVQALESIEQPQDADRAVAEVRAGIQAQQELLSVDEKALWQYIDNTDNAKQPLVDMLERLALQFARLEQSDYFGNAELRALLSPQLVEDPSAKPAKSQKLRTIDHDED